MRQYAYNTSDTLPLSGGASGVELSAGGPGSGVERFMDPAGPGPAIGGPGNAGSDTLSAFADGLTAVREAAVPADTVTAADIFGPATALATQEPGPSPFFEWVLTGNVPYSLAVVVLFAGFCLLFYYFRPHAATVAGLFRGTLYIENLLGEHNYIFETFRRLLILLGLLASGLTIVRYCDSAFGEAVNSSLPGWAQMLPVPVVWGGLLAAWFCQNFILRAAGWLTYGSRFTDDLISLRNLGYGLVFLFTVPLMFTLALAPQAALPVLSWVFLPIVTGLLIFILIRTYMLFIGQKISILYWILYLCAVEILPVSFLVVLSVRSLS
ncbi:MAG: DUF4271 domain-containing protein [Rikenellaceae bacterium]|nr:DUF4271 domain-containing protein [Rikenellaceae bacterium]